MVLRINKSVKLTRRKINYIIQAKNFGWPGSPALRSSGIAGGPARMPAGPLVRGRLGFGLAAKGRFRRFRKAGYEIGRLQTWGPGSA